jgi:N,N'-diacetyllegionaminate synthase
LKVIEIDKRKIGSGHPCFIIAEAGVNHNGNPDLAHQMIEVAAKARADAIKFQTFRAEKVISPYAPKAEYQRQSTGETGNQLEMVRALELPYAKFTELASHCHQAGIMFLSTPFDYESADFLENLGVPAFKISSGDLTNLPFLVHLARKQRPIILSTGMSYLAEVEIALRTIQDSGNPPVILLHCVSNYPAEPEDANLRAMNTLRKSFNVPVGFSDHTLGIEISLAAVTLGASVIEKHFTLNTNLPGPDHSASLVPDQLVALTQGIRKIEAALGNGIKKPATSEINTMQVARRSLVAACDIEAGTILTEKMIAIRRPGYGIAPSDLPKLIGRRINVPIKEGTLLEFGMLQ